MPSTMVGEHQIVCNRSSGTLNCLPTEILLFILERVDALDLPPLICAIYTLLRRRGIASPVSTAEVLAMRRATFGILKPMQRRNHLSERPIGIQTLPLELILHINRQLTIAEKVNYAIAAMWDEYIWPSWLKYWMGLNIFRLN